MQLRIAHMFDILRLDLRLIPSSNLIFTRSRNVSSLGADFHILADMCWPFHKNVINNLTPKIIICMRNDAGNYIRKQLNADLLIDSFAEDNYRGWKSLAYKNLSGQIIIIVTHPSRADWRNPKSDPSILVKRILENS